MAGEGKREGVAATGTEASTTCGRGSPDICPAHVGAGTGWAKRARGLTERPRPLAGAPDGPPGEPVSQLTPKPGGLRGEGRSWQPDTPFTGKCGRKQHRLEAPAGAAQEAASAVRRFSHGASCWQKGRPQTEGTRFVYGHSTLNVPGSTGKGRAQVRGGGHNHRAQGPGSSPRSRPAGGKLQEW